MCVCVYVWPYVVKALFKPLKVFGGGGPMNVWWWERVVGIDWLT